MNGQRHAGSETDELIPLAVIGLAFDFPQQVTSEEKFWEVLTEGRSTSADFPSDRLNIDAFYHPDENRASTLPLRGGHFLADDPGVFDAPFFSITPSEASCMDPQHRRLLEISYHALEDAGIPIEKCIGSNTSVYTGCFTNDYLSILQQDYDAEQRHAALGVAPAMLANRISWFYNFKGTSMNLDSACSSSLVALHIACQDLRAGNSSMALIGGSNMVYHPHFMKILSDSNFLSPDSQCWSFDQRANGYARGEGVAFVVVKRLDDALRDGDTIRAVIRNTGSNQDGHTPAIMQPSKEAQISLINDTYKQGGIDMEPTRYFEAHATGTAIGDPIEGNAIGESFRRYRSTEDPLFVGAVKANLGHLEGCSGLAGVIKTILVLEKGEIPPIAGLKMLNSQIDANSLRLHFPTDTVPWPKCNVRRACINSFGFGGTNATAILDDAHSYLKFRGMHGHHRTRPVLNEGASGYHNQGNRSIDTPMKASLPKLFVWSAPNEDATVRLSEGYRRYLCSRLPQWSSIAYALAAKRSKYPWKNFAVADLGNTLSFNDIVPEKPVREIPNQEARIAFVFTGQGAQYRQMGIQLRQYPVYRGSLESCGECLKQLGCPWPLLEVMHNHDEDTDINLPEYSQPLTTCLQIALVDLLRSVGVVPSVVLGHSSGEIAAAYASGAISRLSAVRIAYHRGRLSSRLLGTTNSNMFSMMAVGLSRDKVTPYIDRLSSMGECSDVTIGCINSPQSVTLSGRTTPILQLQKWLEADGAFARRLRVAVPYHTHFMEQIAGDYASALEKLDAGQNHDGAPMISSISGHIVTTAELCSAEYWVKNLISPVEFEACYSSLLAARVNAPAGNADSADCSLVTHILEIGPHGALRGPIRETQGASTSDRKLDYVPTLLRGENSAVAFLRAMGRLYCAGYPLDLLKVNGIEGYSRPMPSDMPRYPFDHTQRYWIESSLSQNLRFRGAPRHDLLGTRTLDWNPWVAQWRNVMRLTELPWLQDHKLGSDIVFPAAGMVSMAIEALQQLVHDKTSQRGIHVRDVSLLHAISFPSDVDSIETQLTLLRSSEGDASWSQFRLFVREHTSYIECCTGLIRAVFDPEDHARVISAGPWAMDGTVEDWYLCASSACQNFKENPYDMPEGCEIQYGPTFQNLEQMKLGEDGEITAKINTRTSERRDTSSFAQSYSIHPTTLDGLVQPLLFQALLAQRVGGLPTMVPVRVRDLWIEYQHEEQLPNRIEVVALCKSSGYRGGRADVLAVNQANYGSPLMCIEGLETAFIDSGVSHISSSEKPRRLCMKVEWKPDLEMMSNSRILRHCTQDRPRQPHDAVQTYRMQVVLILCFIDEALKYVDQQRDARYEWQFEYYIDWMRHQQSRLRSGESLVTQELVQKYLDDQGELEKLIRQVESSDIDGFLFVQIGRQLVRIIRGEVDPLEIIFRNGLAEQFYEKMLGNDHHAHPASAYIDLLCFKNPSISILEVGAGTGGQTKRLLETMSNGGVSKWSRYDYTDISPSFFEQARDKFSHLGNLNFRVFDVSKDPKSQSFEPGQYDLVIASHVLHATDDLGVSLRNIRTLLKPNGKLLLFEITRAEAIHVGFAFGLLKGWWSPLRHESRSSFSPCINVEQWDSVLKNAGFSGVDVEIPGQEEPYCRDTSIIISTARAASPPSDRANCDVHIVVKDETDSQSPTVLCLKQQLSGFFRAPCNAVTLPKLAASDIRDDSLTIFLNEVDSAFLDGISETAFKDLQIVLVHSKNTIWVTRANPSMSFDPRHHLALGLGRALTGEDASRKFLTLALDPFERDVAHVAKTIYETTQHVLDTPVDSIENSIVAANGDLKICRVIENTALNNVVARAVQPYQTQEHQLSRDDHLRLHFQSPGNIDSLQWLEIGEQDKKPLHSDEIIVEVRAIGLTYRDHMIAKGELNETNIGAECAGVVIDAGIDSGFHRGDRVCLVSEVSTAQTIIRVKAQSAVAVPAHLDFAEAASLASSAWLSYQAIIATAQLGKDDTVLVYQGASCDGDIPIQIAQSLGARVLVTVTAPAQAERFSYHYGLSDLDILNTDEKPLHQEVIRATKGEGVDLIIGALSGAESIEADFAACLAPFGRVIDISLVLNVYPNFSFLKPRTAMNMSKTSIDMSALLRERPATGHRIFRRAMKFVFDHNIKAPEIIHRFRAGDTKAAFRHFERAWTGEKRVLELDHGANIMATVKPKPGYRFPDNATYVIGGGLGGLGRSFARWLVSRGARHLILLSRSGARSEVAKRLVNELQEEGAQVVTPAVDLANLEQLREVIGNLSRSMPPIRGCIQATVALRDVLFQNMSHEDWVVTVNSKVASSWNLHSVLPTSLDFFVILSSINGIMGGRAQANYAAGNTFQDGLAHYRISKGEKAVVFDLGLMVSEGIIAENADLLDNLRRVGLLMDISQGEILALLEHYCDPSLPLLTHEHAQIIIGLETVTAVRAKKIDLHHIMHRPMFRQLFRMDTESTPASNTSTIDYGARLRKASSDEEAGQLITEWYRSKVAHMLGLKVDDVDISQPVRAYGMDSLMAIDLKNWFVREMGAGVQVFHLLGNKSLASMAREVAEISSFRAA